MCQYLLQLDKNKIYNHEKILWIHYVSYKTLNGFVLQNIYLKAVDTIGKYST